MDNNHHVACPRCHAINRVPENRLEENATCGRCKGALFTGAAIKLTDSSFAAHIERSSLPVVVDFWAPWGGPCKMMAPHFERAAAGLEPHVRLAKLDTEENPATAGRFNIRSIPTVIAFRNGQEISRRSGAMDANTLTEWIRQLL